MQRPTSRQEAQAVREGIQSARQLLYHTRRAVSLLNLDVDSYVMEELDKLDQASAQLRQVCDRRIAGEWLDESPVPDNYRRAPGA